MLRLLEMRDIEHLAVNADRASVGIGSKGCDDPTREGDFLRRRREALVDRVYLRGMYGDTSCKALSACRTTRGGQAFLVSEIDIKGFYRRDAGGVGGHQRQ